MCHFLLSLSAAGIIRASHIVKGGYIMFARQKYDNKKDDIAALSEKRTCHTTQHFNAKMCMFVGSQLSRKIGGADCISAMKCSRMIEKLESHLCSVSGQDITAVQKKKSFKVTGMTTTSTGLCQISLLTAVPSCRGLKMRENGILANTRKS